MSYRKLDLAYDTHFEMRHTGSEVEKCFATMNPNTGLYSTLDTNNISDCCVKVTQLAKLDPEICEPKKLHDQYALSFQ